jgi:hypothetical protein
MDERVCPFCGEPPGAGVFCAACGRNLAAVEQLPTRADWAAPADERPPADDRPPTDERALAERCAEATADFLAAMHAAGDPGTTKTPVTGKSGLFRAPTLTGWVVRPVHREKSDDIEDLRNYEPGLVLTTAGAYHRIDSEVRGWGQRDFPRFHDSADPDPVEMPVDERLIDELAALRREAGVA